MPLLSDKQQRNLLIALGLADFATRSRLSTAAFDVVVSTARAVGPAAARGAAAFVPRVAGTAGMIAMRHPYIAGAAALYVGYQERDRIRALLEQGYEFVEEAIPGGIPTPTAMPRPAADFPFVPPFIRARKKSKFNAAVKRGMAVIKQSPSYGKKGSITAPAKALAVVSKVASAIKKKKKAPKSGIRRKIYLALRKLL